jgi:hypothetical protein
MLIKWDTLLVAVAVVGGSVLIENSHRIDTGRPDDDVTATAPAACADTEIAVRIVSGSQEDDASGEAKDNAAVPPALPACSDE